MLIDNENVINNNVPGLRLYHDSKGNRYLFEYTRIYGSILRQIDFNGIKSDCSRGIEFQNLAEEAGLKGEIINYNMLFFEEHNKENLIYKWFNEVNKNE